MFDKDVSNEEEGKALGLVTVPGTQEREQTPMGQVVRNMVWICSGKWVRE